ncbi:MAG: septum formation initiator family protein [Chloroflexi bacterium]|nr:septum formation initiator family protein [Chloroflexota bacterium]
MDMLKCCLNWKVLVGLGAVAVGVLVVEPQIFWSALPTLAVLICPLSMGLMMFGMGKMGGMNNQGAQSGAGTTYSCPMHPEVRSDRPGKCSECGMNLVPMTPPKQAQAMPSGESMAALSREEQLAQLRAQLDSVREQQAALTRQVEELDTSEAVPSNWAVREAEQVARATNKAAQRK